MNSQGRNVLLPLVHQLHRRMERIVAAGSKLELERFLSSLSLHKDLSKTSRYDLIIQARALTFDAIGIKETLRTMRNDGMKVGKIALRALIQYHVGNGDMEGAEELCMSVPKFGEDGLDAHMIVTMISGWGKKGMMERAERLFSMVPELHNSAHLVTAMIGAYYEAGEYGKAIELANRASVQRDIVLSKLLVKCFFKDNRRSTALIEWGKISKMASALDWLEMANLFVVKGPDYVLQMTLDAIDQFGIVRGVPEMAGLAISRSNPEKKHALEMLFDRMHHCCTPQHLFMLSTPLCALVDSAKRSKDKELLGFCKMKHEHLADHFNHLRNVELVAKIGTF